MTPSDAPEEQRNSWKQINEAGVAGAAAIRHALSSIRSTSSTAELPIKLQAYFQLMHRFIRSPYCFCFMAAEVMPGFCQMHAGVT
jgi:hypothetical protein